MMNQYKCSKLENNRWGIFSGDKMLASIASYAEAKMLVKHLQLHAAVPSDSHPAADSVADPLNQIIPVMTSRTTSVQKAVS